jgi:hypothetical protein
VADDLKLEIVIQALLDAKGFEEAKANLGSLTNQANATAPAVKNVGDKITGARGPVADLTRVLLINIGATRGAGEAAKLAGVGLAALEAGAIGASIPIIALTAGIAVVVPLVVSWLNSSKDLSHEQEELRDKLLGSLDMVQRWVENVPNATQATKNWSDALQGLNIEKQKDHLRELNQELDKLTHEALDAGETFKSPAILAIEAEIETIRKAKREGLTVEQQFKKDSEAAKENAVVMSENLKNINAGLAQHFKGLQVVAEFEAQARKDQKNATRSEALDRKKDSADRRKALEDEADRILAYRRLQEEQIRIDKEVAFQKVAIANQTTAAMAQTASALSSLFGKNKALAIAGAIMDTYAAANQVLKDPSLTGTPYLRWALAAAAIATGLANVNSIRSANPGFDDPFADLTARKLGRKSAVDFVANFGAGFHGAMGAMSGGGSVSHNTTINRGTNVGAVNIHGFMGAGKTELMKTLNRELTKVQRLERRATLGR